MLAGTVPAVAQTTSMTGVSKPPRSRTVARTEAECETAPAVPAGLPSAPGPAKMAYALRYVDTEAGPGELAPASGYLTVHYTGWLASDGTKFDSSVDRNEPFTFQQGTHGVIPGWDYGFAGMHVGGKRRLFIPYQLAYGEHGRPPVIPPTSNLIFDIELLSASDTPPPPEPSAPPPSEQPATPPPSNTPPPSR